MEALGNRLHIGVIGAGIAGLSAAHLLSREHEVTLLEKNDYLGGHTNTKTIVESEDEPVDIDTGFIVCNPVNYPLFYRFLQQLGVVLRDSDMSFGFSCGHTGLSYTGPAIREFLGQPGNFLRPRFVRMIWEQCLLNRRALRDLETGALKEIPLGEYLQQVGASKYFLDHYLLPLSAAIWSSPDEDMLQFPALTFFTFLRNHGMLELSKRPMWQTVVGGSHAYVKAFKKLFQGQLHTDCAVRSIRRQDADVLVRLANGEERRFDRIVLGCHADESLALLQDPSPSERRLLGSWSYHRNKVVLHTDSSVLPPNKKLWASWNYFRSTSTTANEPVPVTYYMNRLQGLSSKRDYFVTLNRARGIDPKTILFKTEYTHPAYTPQSVAAQTELQALNGQNNTYYCGAYMGYGFHEDGISSAVAVAKHFGEEL